MGRLYIHLLIYHTNQPECRQIYHTWSVCENVYMGVSLNGGTPTSSILIGIFHYKLSILGYPYFWKYPHVDASTCSNGPCIWESNQVGDLTNSSSLSMWPCVPRSQIFLFQKVYTWKWMVGRWKFILGGPILRGYVMLVSDMASVLPLAEQVIGSTGANWRYMRDGRNPFHFRLTLSPQGFIRNKTQQMDNEKTQSQLNPPPHNFRIGWWLNQPIWKIFLSKRESSPIFGVIFELPPPITKC